MDSRRHGARDRQCSKVDTLGAARSAEFQGEGRTFVRSLLRRIDDTSGPDGGPMIETGASMRAEYELYHNLLLNVGGTYRIDDIATLSTPETYYSGHVGLEYYMTKNWLFTFTYQHDVRESDSEARNMHRNRFMIGAKLRF